MLSRLAILFMTFSGVIELLAPSFVLETFVRMQIPVEQVTGIGVLVVRSRRREV